MKIGDIIRLRRMLKDNKQTEKALRSKKLLDKVLEDVLTKK